MSSPAHPNDLLTSLLRDVSRSFYLTLRVLPAAVRTQIGLAYLLARATDTIADTEIIPVAGRLAALDQLRNRILGRTTAIPDFTPFAKKHAPGTPAATTDSEWNLLLRIDEALAILDALPAADRELIREVLDTITSGQELDLQRFGAASAQNILALETDAELDDYTYRVAGCVGAFWTKMCRAHLFPRAPLDDAPLMAHGIRFGKGLQLVNILRDLPVDLRKGRCYLPARELAAAGLAPADLLDPAGASRLQPIYQSWLGRARGHLVAGWEYTNALPFSQVRVRLACAWPILIGIKTLEKLAASPILDPTLRIKASRSEVRGVLVRTIVCYPFPNAWRRLFPPQQG